MQDREGVAFLQWALPRLHRPWAGFRRVRKKLCHGVEARARALGLPDLAAYRAWLETHPEEWQRLDELCPVTISCFYRDPPTWAALTAEVLPELAERTRSRGAGVLRAASIGCASGEEPYTLSLAWQLEVGPRFPALRLAVTATDVDEVVLERARAGRYEAGTVKLLPAAWREQGFEREGELYRLRDRFREGVTFLRQDLRAAFPEGPLALIFCRNLAFTYFDAETQEVLLSRLLAHLEPGGALVIGKREQLPRATAELTPWSSVARQTIFRHVPNGPSRG